MFFCHVCIAFERARVVVHRSPARPPERARENHQPPAAAPSWSFRASLVLTRARALARGDAS